MNEICVVVLACSTHRGRLKYKFSIQLKISQAVQHVYLEQLLNHTYRILLIFGQYGLPK